MDDLDFGTYQQAPEKWEHTERYRAKHPKKAHWDKAEGENVL